MEHTQTPQPTVSVSEFLSVGGLGIPGVCSEGMLGFSYTEGRRVGPEWWLSAMFLLEGWGVDDDNEVQIFEKNVRFLQEMSKRNGVRLELNRLMITISF